MRGSTNSDTSAYDTVTQRAGVCRDFAHLGIALCRALNIPARYFTGYAYELDPPDFHACFECYLGGRWMVFDATRLAHLNGLVRIAHRPRRRRRRRGQHLRRLVTLHAHACLVRRSPTGQTLRTDSRRQLVRRGVTLPTGTD